MTVLASDTEGAIAATQATYASTYSTTQVAALNTVGAQITAGDAPGTGDYARFAALSYADLVHYLNLAAGVNP